jgi:hypothetical protein
MNAADDKGPKTRRRRLAAIAEEYTEEIHDPRTGAALSGGEPIPRYAAVTSEGSPESSYASNGNLLLADSTAQLAELLRQECGEGWLAHGRVWDLDAPWHSWGNLEAIYSVRVGEEGRPLVNVISVAGRPGGVYLFEDLLDAEAFREAVHRQGGEADLMQKYARDHRRADRLIDEERGR